MSINGPHAYFFNKNSKTRKKTSVVIMSPILNPPTAAPSVKKLVYECTILTPSTITIWIIYFQPARMHIKEWRRSSEYEPRHIFLKCIGYIIINEITTAKIGIASTSATSINMVVVDRKMKRL